MTSPYHLASLTEPQWNTLCEIVDGKRRTLGMSLDDKRLVARNLLEVEQ